MLKYILILALSFLPTAAANGPDVEVRGQEIMCRKSVTEKTLTHRQRVWMYALEWCESRGDAGAINPMDRDGTPSLGCFQFKPTTLSSYALYYGISTTTVMDCEVQTKVVTQMILHQGEINWHNEFPVCVDTLGIPPS